MKVLVINGSYSKDGATAALVRNYLTGMASKTRGMKVKTADLRDMKFKFCDGCAACMQNDGKRLGECHLQDAMNDFLSAMLEADQIVCASPVYFFSLTAVMMKYLERCAPLMYEGPRGPVPRTKPTPGKKGVILLSTDVPYPWNIVLGHTRAAKKALSLLCAAAGCSKVLSLSAGAMDSGTSVKEKFLRKAHALGVAAAE